MASKMIRLTLSQTPHRPVGRFLAILSCSFLISACERTSQSTVVKTIRPNVIIITADDLGYGDLGSYGHPNIRTPHLDRMASEGLRWTSFYAQAPVCSPSRAALLTGRLHLRSGMFGRHTAVLFPDSRSGLPTEEITLAESLSDLGYTTGIIGKWHLGHRPQYLPIRHGFDYWFGVPYSNDMDWNLPNGLEPRAAYFQPETSYWQVPLIRNDTELERPVDQTTLTKRYTEEAVAFIETHQDEPFFLYMPHSMPHMPLFVSDQFSGQSTAGIYGDVVEEIDWSVGQVIMTLEAANLARQTLVIFTSDNGPWLSYQTHAGSSGLLRDGKGTTFEGGMRVPGIFWWPGMIEPAVTQEIGSAMDLFTTVISLAGGQIPTDRPIDGMDLSPVLFGTGSSPRETMAYYRMGELFAFRQGSYKAHFVTEGRYGLPPLRTDHNPPLLFNLDEDPGELFDIASTDPDVLTSILAEVSRHRTNLTIGDPLFDSRETP